MKHIHFMIDSERLVNQSFSADFISIEWIESPDSRDNCGGTDYCAGTDFLIVRDGTVGTLTGAKP